MAQTEVKSISEDELSAILGGNVDSVLTPPEEKTETKETDEVEKPEDKTQEGTKPFKKPINDDFTWEQLQESAKKDEETDETETKENPTDSTKNEPAKTKPTSKKNNDVVSIINELIEEGDLFGYEDGPVKDVAEIKELLKANVKEIKKGSFEDLYKEKVESFSPQVQAILKYAENGGQDITPLLSAISQVEEMDNFDIETEEGQEGILREYLKVSGWSEDDIKDEIETAKDLNKLKIKAERFLPKLNQMHQERIDQMMAEQEETDRQAEAARQNYLATIRNTLAKDKLGDMKLSRQDKAMLWEGLTDVKYKSWSGQPTNKFFKRIEELQAGKTADYEHFLKIVHMALDPQGFEARLKEKLKTEGTVETARQLKIDQKRNSNSETLFEEENRKPTIKRTGFKNPFA